MFLYHLSYVFVSIFLKGTLCEFDLEIDIYY